MRHLPSWIPGAGFKRYAVEWRKLIEAFVNEPYEDCKQKIVGRLLSPPPPACVLTCPRIMQQNGTASPSFTSLAFDKDENMTEQQDFDLRWTINSMYTGSIDTVRSRSPRIPHAQQRVYILSRLVLLSPIFFSPWLGIPRFSQRLRQRSTSWLDTRGCQASPTVLLCLTSRPC